MSCATLKHLRFEKPTIEFDALEISGVSFEGGSLVLWLEIYNPNDYEIRTTWVESTLHLEGTRFGTAVLEESVTLAAASNTTVKIPATFTWKGIGAGARALLDRGAVDYLLETRIKVQTSLGGHTVSFENKGEVPII